MSERSKRIVGVVFVVGLGLFFALMTLGGIIDAAGSSSSHAHRQTSLGGDIALAIIGSLLCAGCVLWAIHLEHRLRSQHPVAAAFQPARTFSFTPTPLRRRGRYGPAVLVVESSLLVLGFVFLVASAFVNHGDAERSAEVQAHGIPAIGAVTSTDNITHHGRYSTWYSANIDVSLASAVLGETSTIVHYPAWSNLQRGEKVRFLVDPQEPTYAEFAGAPSAKASSWIILAVFAVIDGLVTLLVLRLALRVVHHRTNMSRTTLGVT